MKIMGYHILLAALVGLGFLSCDNNKKGSIEQSVLAGSTPEINALTEKISASPADASLYATRGVLWYDFQNFDQGIADLEKAISLDSSKAEYFHGLADFYLDYYKSKKGLNVMERAGKIFPRRIPTLLKLSEFQLILKQNQEALLTLERIRALDPLNAEMFFMFGRIFKEMDKKDQAANAFQSAVENDPDLIDAWINLAQLLAEKNSPVAEKYFDNALRVDSNSIEALHAKAYFLSNHKNDLYGAIQLYKKINTIDQQYEDGYFNAGLIYLDMDSIEQAYRSFDLAIKFAPTYGDAYYYRGLAAGKKGDKAQAEADFKLSKELTPKKSGEKE